MISVQVRWDGQVVAGVSRVAPLRRTVDVVTLRDGASGAVVKVPGRSDTQTVTFERGLSDDLAFDIWASGPQLRKDVELQLLDASAGLTVVFRLHQCWVSEYAVSPDVETGVVIESITLSVNAWERVTPPPAVIAGDLAARRAGLVRRVSLSSLLTGVAEQSEHNLQEVLREAESTGAVLLFDEADALFAQRAQVQDDLGRFEPTEVEALLKRLSAFPGQVLVAPVEDPAGTG